MVRYLRTSRLVSQGSDRHRRHAEDVVARVQEITSGAGVDRIVEVAFGANLPISAQILKTSGVIATYSSDADPTPSIPFGQFLGKDLTVRFVLVYMMGEAAHQEA